ncbi:MAG: FAD-dependent oxidoreductase, partial [Bdellovibrionales bacterium]
HLAAAGEKDFSLWELEKSTGGNALWGENSTSRFPWGAHYLPLPDPKNTPLLKFLESAGAITGWSKTGLPVYNELYTCHDPQERIFDNTQWSSGLLPLQKMSDADNSELARFSALMEEFHAAKGKDGKAAFAIPVENSSQDESFLRYDAISMADYLSQNGFSSPALSWYVNYCMRDDFGTLSSDVSAWAGIHYFAARGGQAANLESHSLLTWPEGNGWLCNRLAAPIAAHIRANQVVFKIKNTPTGALVDAWDVREKITRRVEVEKVIFAAPRYTAFSILDGYSAPEIKKAFQYSTWFIANVTLDSMPASFNNAPLSWDNIRYQSELLGYVVATHQDIKRFETGTVLTVYWPITHLRGNEARQWARQRTDREWQTDVLKELESMHPGISGAVLGIETKIWGHAMIQPRVGFFAGQARKLAQEQFGNTVFAHTDMSGISIFEHGFESGRRAAHALLERRA